MKRFVRLLVVALAVVLGSMPSTAADVPVLQLGLSIDDDATSVIYAQRAGLFHRAGFDVALQRQTSGAAVAAATLAGTFQIGKAGLVALFNAHLRGVPLSMVAPAGLYESRSPYALLLVAKDSSVQSAHDLEGKLVSVPSLNDLNQVVVAAWLDQHGADVKKVKFVELPFSATGVALEEHRVDAGLLVYPPLAQAMAGGKLRALGPAMDAIAPVYLFSGWFVANDWGHAHPEIVRNFARIVAQAAAYTNSHHEETAPMLADASGFSLPLIQSMPRITDGTTLIAAQIQPLLDFAVKYGIVARSFPAQDLFFTEGATK